MSILNTTVGHYLQVWLHWTLISFVWLCVDSCMRKQGSHWNSVTSRKISNTLWTSDAPARNHQVRMPQTLIYKTHRHQLHQSWMANRRRTRLSSCLNSSCCIWELLQRSEVTDWSSTQPTASICSKVNRTACSTFCSTLCWFDSAFTHVVCVVNLQEAITWTSTHQGYVVLFYLIYNCCLVYLNILLEVCLLYFLWSYHNVSCVVYWRWGSLLDGAGCRLQRHSVLTHRPAWRNDHMWLCGHTE